MNSKKFLKNIIRFFLVFGLVLCLVMGFVFIVDPLYQFRSPLFGMPVILEDAVYQTPGAARNLQYSAAVVGSSMTQNFRTSEFDKAYNTNTIKLSYAGAFTKDYREILGQIFESDNSVSYIFMDINDFQLFQSPDEWYVDRPAYLYNQRIWGKYKYLLNYDCVRMSLARVLDGISGRESNMDTAYFWTDNPTYSKESLLTHYEDYYSNYLAWAEEGSHVNEEMGVTETRIADNIANITYYVELHPETEFVVFVPPYSILYWMNISAQGKVPEKIYEFETASRLLLNNDNVKLYSFMADKEVIENLDNYRDECHYSPEINSYIIEKMAEGDGEITKDNLETFYDDLQSYVENYDYLSIWDK